MPASAILHLHDRDWVFIPAGGKQFKRVEVNAGDMLPGRQAGDSLRYCSPASRWSQNVLQLEATLEAQ